MRSENSSTHSVTMAARSLILVHIYFYHSRRFHNLAVDSLAQEGHCHGSLLQPGALQLHLPRPLPHTDWRGHGGDPSALDGWPKNECGQRSVHRGSTRQRPGRRAVRCLGWQHSWTLPVHLRRYEYHVLAMRLLTCVSMINLSLPMQPLAQLEIYQIQRPIWAFRLVSLQDKVSG